MRWPRNRRLVGAGRLVVTAAVALIALASCSVLAESPQEQESSDAIAAQIQTALAARPDVVTVKVGYQNNLSAAERVDVTATLTAGTDFTPFIDEVTRLVWQSKLHPLSSINISVSDADDIQRSTSRHLAPADEDKTELERKYGPRPPK
ncbi:hypothetical protein ACQEVC_10765 [Plantactinospora sp. CA-294935]|uniref:hypothetical protein n=1 Tax=Plantactinospora sp. CA-294935 TaxID=3240012 RepID=UPI003D91E369